MGDIYKKMTQIELKLEPTVSEMKNMPDGIYVTLDIADDY